MQELGRIVGRERIQESTRVTWGEMAPSIIRQANLEEGSSSVRSALSNVEDLKGA